MPGNPSLSRTERALRSSIAAHESWANTPDRSARTAPARAALMARFEREVDPDGILPSDERARRADHKRRAYFGRLALKSAKARRARTMVAAGEAADAELAALGGEPPGEAAIPAPPGVTASPAASQPLAMREAS